MGSLGKNNGRYANARTNTRSSIREHEVVNCEFIGDKLIEVHLRHNPDFEGNIMEFIPVWEGEDTTAPNGYKYREYPDVHGRIGAFIR